MQLPASQLSLPRDISATSPLQLAPFVYIPSASRAAAWSCVLPDRELSVRFAADVHIHSRFARATSRDLNAVNLHRWSALKGVTVVGTGDFTHPEWLAELKEHLTPAEPGLYRLREDLAREVDAEIYPSCRNDVRFVLSSEISLS